MQENTHAALVAEEMERLRSTFPCLTKILITKDGHRDVEIQKEVQSFLKESMLKAARAAVEAGELGVHDYKESVEIGSEFSLPRNYRADGWNANNAERRRKLADYFSDTV